MHRTATIRMAAILGLTGLLTPASAQQRAADLGSLLLQTPSVRAAVEFAKTDELRTIDDQVKLCEVEAPPFQEAKRAELYASMFRDAGLRNVRIDAEGNVIGERPGASARPNVVLSAHLDTVFPRGTNVKVRRDGYVLRGPGVGDDCRGLADVLAVARALNKAAVSTPGTITFVGTVGEEGLGDLRGVKRLFNETLKDRIDRFVSIDGEGLGVTRTVSRYVQRTGRPQLRIVRRGKPDPRARAGDGAYRRLPGAWLVAHHVQRRPHRRWHVDQCHFE
jgi:acetylornithine deacetylase/succinyl-diaminopimelate desuccinylase-like protein